MNKEFLNTIINDIKNLIAERKWYNRDYKNLVNEQLATFKNSFEYDPQYNDIYFDKNSEYTWEHWAPDYLRKSFYQERQQLLGNYHNNQFYHIIYKDGSERIFGAEDILTGEAKYIKFNNVAYAHMTSADDDMDTETGNLNYDISIDEQFEAYQKYFEQIEIKYNTTWGRKQTA